ncbi:MAG: vWA domain-containing protein [Xenococcus sp. (in: cyanobacteria)]
MLDFINFRKITKRKLIATSLLSASLVGLLATSAPADETALEVSGEVTPSSFTKDTRVANPVELERTVILDLKALATETETGNYIKPEKLDVLFLADNTGSMGAAIANVKAHATDLLEKLEAEYNDVEFGVAYYRRDPREWGSRAYSRKIGQTTETIEVTVQDTKKVVVDTVACTKTWKFNRVDPNRSNKPYQYRLRTTDKSGKKLRDQWPWSNNGDLDGKTESCTFNITKKVPVGEPRTVTKTKKKNIYERTPREYLSYKLLEAVDGGDKNDAVKAINKWKAIDTGDWPEAGFFGLHQAATNGAPTPEYPSNPGDSKYANYPGADVYSTGYNYMLQGTSESYDPADYNENYNTKWREDADMKLIVMFGDAQSHTKTITQADTIKALQDNGITVIMINVDTITGDPAKETELGLTVAADGLNGDDQASSIVAATNGKYSEVDNDVLVELLNGPPIDYSNEYCSNLEELDLVCTILGSVGDAAVVPEVVTTYPKVNIDFNTNSFNPIDSKTAEAMSLSIGPFSENGQCIGYDTCVKYECTDPLGCDQVGHEEVRKFKMTFQGQLPAEYNFDTVVVDGSGKNINGTISTNAITIHNID